MDTNRFIANIKTAGVYADLAKGVKKRFDTWNYEVERHCVKNVWKKQWSVKKMWKYIWRLQKLPKKYENQTKGLEVRLKGHSHKNQQDCTGQ